jgi:hypothetical protein
MKEALAHPQKRVNPSKVESYHTEFTDNRQYTNIAVDEPEPWYPHFPKRLKPNPVVEYILMNKLDIGLIDTESEDCSEADEDNDFDQEEPRLTDPRECLQILKSLEKDVYEQSSLWIYNICREHNSPVVSTDNKQLVPPGFYGMLTPKKNHLRRYTG